MAQTATNVTAAKPATGGAISVAEAGTTLPTDATTALGTGFRNMGYLSEDGLVNSGLYSAETVKAWGGDVVLEQDNAEKQWKFTMIEALNVDVLKFTFGDDAVSGTLENGISIEIGDSEHEEKVLVADVILKGGVLKRTVIPRAIITEVADVSYTDSDAIGYAVTVQANKDSSGKRAYVYIAAPTGAANG